MDSGLRRLQPHDDARQQSISDARQDATQRDLHTGIAAELAVAGFGDAEEIGRGGFGVVYRCFEYALERPVAVKLLMSEVRGDGREQFVREQQALGRLSGHPHILQVLQVDITATGRPYIVMPYHARGSLDQLLRTTGPLRWPDVLSIGVKMAGALAAAHSIGIVHRDVKPGNILLTSYGEPQLADFGIAEFGDATAPSVRTIQGTPAFTAPEVLGGATPSAASDIYGLGATLSCLLTGRARFTRHTGEPLQVQLAAIATAPIPDLREHGVPHAFCAAVEAAMATRPADRPASAVEFGERLRDVQHGLGKAVDAMAVLPGVDESDSAATSLVPPLHSPGSATPPPPPIASTKFRPPTAPRTLIERTRLLHLLRQGGDRRLTLIHGPPGFGKTTLAAQWGRLLESEGVPMAWLTADTDDDNVVWFLAHLVEAIRRVRPELARELGAMLEERSSDATRYVLSVLIDEIHDSGQAMVLVIDEWHQVTSGATIAALEYLLEHGCHHLRVVVTSRTRAALPITRMLVADELVEIDTTTLRFDTAEANAFLVEANGLRLTSADVARLQESTEGWAAALQLASLPLRGRDDPSAFIDQLTGRNQIIGEYLAENVLDSLEPQVLDFLLATSITGTVRADLATALSGRSDSQELLEQIADRGLFLLHMDEVAEWFRYHRLFADYLRRRIIRQDPDRFTQLHHCASAWFAEHDMLSDAVDHALSAGEPQRAVDVVEARAMDLIERSRMATFLGIVAKLPGSLTESRPHLQLCVAWANIGLQRSQPVRTALQHALAALDAGAVSDAQATALRLEAAMVTSIEQYVTDRFERLPDVLAEHLHDPTAPFLAVTAMNLAAIDAFNRFDFASEHRWHQQAARYARQGGSFAVMHGHCVSGLAAREQFDIAGAEEHFEAAIAVSTRTGAQTHSSILAGALLGDLRYEQGRLTEAEVLLNASAGLGRQGGPVDFLLATFGTGARLAALRGDHTIAEERLAAGAAIAEHESLPRLAARIANERIRIGLPIPDDLRTHLTHLPPYLQQDNRIRASIAELEQDSMIRLLLAEDSPASTEAACARAAHLVRAIGNQHRPRAFTQAQLLYGCCLWLAGRHDEAKTVLAQSVSLCTDHGLTRFLADAGPQIAEISAASG
ncbi:protein kinase [Nocardia sp. NBC_00565]|uniref:protein kinase domain-containing protein n=1 Tax=Nocardia sp. NBC_00565 TaxID=2975993 RepID=UPI002E81C7D6|nr:protein kinase [Nocardia sp. NBC_00565]WUC00110.1 protein kinase [Nocardia sp. NBC_00565]